MSVPSKYDVLARTLCDELDADAVVVIVVNGPRGHGACRAEKLMISQPRPALRAFLVGALRALADSIERDEQPGRTTLGAKLDS